MKEMYINDAQAISRRWEEQVVDKGDLTPRGRFARMMEEVMELDEEIEKYDGTPGRALIAGYEVADVIIVAMGIASALGVDMERIIHEKMEVNHRKYNPIVNKGLRQNGMTPNQALVHQKTVYSYKP